MRSRTNACLLRHSICRKQQKQPKQKVACWRRTRKESAEDGGGRVLRACLFLPALLFILYSICIVLQLAARVSRERLNQKKKSGVGEAREGIPGHKRFTSPRPQPVFQAGTIHVEEKIRSEIGRAGGGGGPGGGEHGWETPEKYTLSEIKLVDSAVMETTTLSWEDFGLLFLLWPFDGSTRNSFWRFYPEHILTGEGSCQNLRGFSRNITWKVSPYLEPKHIPPSKVSFSKVPCRINTDASTNQHFVP